MAHQTCLISRKKAYKVVSEYRFFDWPKEFKHLVGPTYSQLKYVTKTRLTSPMSRT